MIFDPPLIFGTLLRRYNRFLADVELPDGGVVTAHCTNTGSLKMCSEPGWRVGLSESANPGRKLRFTWEIVNNGRDWIGINTHRANRLAEEALTKGWIRELAGYPVIQRERPYGTNSRIDFLLSHPGRPRLYVEVKNVTLIGSDGCYCFPDAPTERGRKHLRELCEMVRQGHRAVMLYVIQRPDGSSFRPAFEIDPDYADALHQAVSRGVEVLAYRADVSPERIELHYPVTIHPDWAP